MEVGWLTKLKGSRKDKKPKIGPKKDRRSMISKSTRSKGPC